MFKVGDKVCDPVRFGNGIIEKMSGLGIYPVLVRFEDGNSACYAKDGRFQADHKLPTLYPGHMEEGTGKTTFEPKKEPVYEWQWEFETGIGFSKYGTVTTHYVSEQAMLKDFASPNRKDFIRIERSKRERKE